MKDIIILGAGPGGYELALAASRRGLSVVLIEEHEVGGTCLHHGCIPTKAYYKSAEVLRELKQLSDYGISGTFSFDFSKTSDRKNEIVKTLTQGIKFLLNKAHVEWIYGRGKIISPNQVAVNGEIFEGKYIVIATGSSAAMLPLPGADSEGVMTSTELLELKDVPKKLVVIGGGVIGIELATIFNQFGTEVDVIEAMDSILPPVDREISKRLQIYLKGQGIRIHTKATVSRIEAGLKVYFTEKDSEQTVAADKVLVAVGRRPNVNDIGLENTKVIYDRKGIKVNTFFQTNVPNIYAIGDVTGTMMLAHSASYSGYHVLKHILKEESLINFEVLPSCVFTFPEIASVGFTEDQCEEADVCVQKYYFKANGKALTINETDGFVKIISVCDIIRGVHILGPHASDLIHEFVPIMNRNIPISELNDYIHAHPTLSETLAGAFRE